MENIISELFDLIRLLPSARVDCNFGQGKDTLAKHLAKHFGEDAECTETFTNTVINRMNEIDRLTRPFFLPNDYRYFLEMYGGFTIQSHDYRLDVFGVGPMVMEWYGSLKEENPQLFNGDKCIFFALLHTLDPNLVENNKYIAFTIDVEGVFQKGGVYSIGPDDGPEHISFIKDKVDTQVYRKIANSFTDWLKIVAETQGLCGLEKLLL